MSHFDWLRENYLDQPLEVSLETYSKCNAACTFCPYPTLERIGNKMDDDLIDRLIGEMATFEKPFLFSPFKVNEPLLDKRLFPILERMNKEVPRGLIRVFTNGAALNWDNAEKLSWVDNCELYISVNSHIKEEYEPLMALSFDRMVANVDSLHSSDFPHPVTLTKVGLDPGFLRFCEQRWPRFKPVLIKKDGWLGYTEPGAPAIPDTPCARWFELSVMSTGVVSLCCMDSDGSYAIGDLNDQTLLEVYNSPNWRQRREEMVSRKTIHPCSTCTY